ncbi:hypothetical protein [Carboxylicivirga marina]|uniref:hypothetical protein n=1 Tax=Carboxylicivirga marina TaxID=2800988 RepID=UPI00259A5E42|nr:hypothetical protein [uncultured Carboxylicivirga sp.]
MKDALKKAVENESEQELIKCLDFKQTKKITSDQYALIEKALIGTWHSQHEDLVNTIYLKNLRDDRFVDPIVNIALSKDVFRWYDDELESTLRKCVHALKTIDSKKSSAALEKLKNLKNENVMIALEMYK